MSGGSPMLLRIRGGTGVPAATVRIGNRAGASAWIVGGIKVFCWLSASKSVTQTEVAVGGQVWVAALLVGGSTV
jgi:hypothetical protein